MKWHLSILCHIEVCGDEKDEHTSTDFSRVLKCGSTAGVRRHVLFFALHPRLKYAIISCFLECVGLSLVLRGTAHF